MVFHSKKLQRYKKNFLHKMLKLVYEQTDFLFRTQAKKDISFEEWEKITNYAKLSFSQEGEDAVLQTIFAGKNNGFFVDVGAHHPYQISNTFALYLKGWRGINIEPNPELFELFKMRSEDINLNVGVSETVGKLPYYMMDRPACNTFSEHHMKIHENMGFALKEIKEIEVLPLSEILDQHLGSNTIDYMNIDAECFEIQILKSNNWEKYLPKIITIEELDFNDDSENIDLFLKNKGYEYLFKTGRTCFYKLKEQ